MDCVALARARDADGRAGRHVRCAALPVVELEQVAVGEFQHRLEVGIPAGEVVRVLDDVAPAELVRGGTMGGEGDGDGEKHRQGSEREQKLEVAATCLH